MKERDFLKSSARPVPHRGAAGPLLHNEGKCKRWLAWAKHRASGQFFRFIIAGTIATMVDFAILVLLKGVCGWHYLSANAVSFMIGNVASYWLCIWWVFNTRSMEDKALEFFIFAIVGAGALGISQFCMWTLAGVLGLYYLLAKCVSVGCTLFFNFFVKRLLLFQERRRVPEDAGLEE